MRLLSATETTEQIIIFEHARTHISGIWLSRYKNVQLLFSGKLHLLEFTFKSYVQFFVYLYAW